MKQKKRKYYIFMNEFHLVMPAFSYIHYLMYVLYFTINLIFFFLLMEYHIFIDFIRIDLFTVDIAFVVP